MKIRELPSGPGVYIFLDSSGKSIYAGKALNIKKRVRSHFSGSKNPRQLAMLARVRTVDFIETANEKEALVLEESLIKSLRPRYNVLLRDDKSYPFLEVTAGEKYPAIRITRNRKDKRSLYFGPFPDVGDTRRAVKILGSLFPLRKCRTYSPKEKPCLNYQIKKCAGPCCGKISSNEYKEIVDELLLFLRGRKEELLKKLKDKMEKEKKRMEYEKAAQLRDRIYLLNNLFPIVNFRKINAQKMKALEKVDPFYELKKILGLKKRPSLIEGFDISHTSSREAAGSSVRFGPGGPDRSNYRRFKIKQPPTSDDLKMIKEVVYRRLKRLKKDNKELPDIILVDGGRGQEKAAAEALKLLNIRKVKILALAKGKKNIYFKGRKLDIEKNSEAFKLLTRVDREAHRFARSYHIKRRKNNSEN